MTRWIFSIGCLALMVCPAAAIAGKVSVEATCPAQANPGEGPWIRLRIENDTCFADVTGRVMSSMVGHNGGSTVGEVGVFGPVMVNSSLTIPEAADCGVLPGVIFLQFEAAPIIPTSMTGEMATYLFVFEREEGAMISAQCVIEVL